MPIIPHRPTPAMIAAAEAILGRYPPVQPMYVSIVDWPEVGQEIARAMFGPDVDPALGDAIGEVLDDAAGDHEPTDWITQGKRIWAATAPFRTELPPHTCLAHESWTVAFLDCGDAGGEVLMLTTWDERPDAASRWIDRDRAARYRDKKLPNEGFAAPVEISEHTRAKFLESYRKHANEAHSAVRAGDEVNDALRAVLSKPRTVRFWGEDYEITPAVPGVVFGDGLRLMFVEPLNTRPNYYVVRVDSTWSKEEMGEHIDDVLAALEDEFGEAWPEPDDELADELEDELAAEPEEGDFEGDHDKGPRAQIHRPFPALSEDSGVSWGRYEWPPSVAPHRAILVNEDAKPSADQQDPLPEDLGDEDPADAPGPRMP